MISEVVVGDVVGCEHEEGCPAAPGGGTWHEDHERERAIRTARRAKAESIDGFEPNVDNTLAQITIYVNHRTAARLRAELELFQGVHVDINDLAASLLADGLNLREEQRVAERKPPVDKIAFSIALPEDTSERLQSALLSGLG